MLFLGDGDRQHLVLVLLHYVGKALLDQVVGIELFTRSERLQLAVGLDPELELFPVWRYHPFFTDSVETTTEADITHRRHAIIETVFADLIDGPLAHLPSGRFPANAAWAICAGMTHNLLRAAGTLTSERHAVARGVTLRRQIVAVPARPARPQRRPVLHLPAHWPWASQWKTLWDNVFPTPAGPPAPA